MSDNHWNQPNSNGNGHHPMSNDSKPRIGNLLSSYRQQQGQGPYQHSPTSMPPTQGPPEYAPLPPHYQNRSQGLAPYSPLPPSVAPTVPQQGGQFPPPSQQQSRPQYWIAN